MTNLYELEMMTLSDVSPAANRERGFHTPVLPYLPGGAIRGALASLWKTRFGEPNSEFQQAVGKLRIGPGIALGSRQRPLSVFSCKYPTKPSCVTAIDAAMEPLPEPRVCPGCDRGLEASKGQWDAGPRVRRTTRTALQSDQTALEGSLFSRDALEAGQEFRATAVGDLSWLGREPVRIRIGGRRSTAGLVTLTARPADTVVEEIPDPYRLVVRLLSPGVFVDDTGRTHLQPQPGDVVRAFGGEASEVQSREIRIRGAWTRPDTVGGWNAAAQLPKSTEVTSAAGSTYVFEATVPFTSRDVATLVRRGLGLRRGDGLGWVEIATTPWRSTSSQSPPPTRPSADPTVEQIAHRLSELNRRHEDRSRLRRRVSGWLRQGYTPDSLPPGVAFDTLPNRTRVVVEDALSLDPLQRRSLLIVLQAHDWTDKPQGRSAEGSEIK